MNTLPLQCRDLETLLETREMLPLRDADKGVFVTTLTSVAGTCSQQPLEGNGAATILSALSNSSAAVDKEASSQLCACMICVDLVKI